MKTILKSLILTAMLLTNIHAFASDFEVNGIYYNITSETDKTVEVTSGTDKYSGEVVIPETATVESTTYAVSMIGEEAFGECSSLTKITIPNSVTTIGSGAFWGCSGITSISIPNSVVTIGEYAFDSCENLTNLTIPNSVVTIGEEAFSGCSGLNSITVEAGNPVFDSRNDCNAIIETATDKLILGCNSTIIPDGVKEISSSAFNSCNNLTSITIPKSVISVGPNSFDSNYLTTIIVEDGNTVYDSRDNCNAIIETESNTLILGCKSTIIPNGVIIIGESAFSFCENLTSITIPNSVTTIKYNAFGWCKGLTSITIPKSITHIGNPILSGCNSLTTITVEEGNTVYDSRDNCNAIIETSKNLLTEGCKSTVIPNDITRIGRYAFYAQKGLTSITIPNSVNYIDWAAFYDCNNLTEIYCKPTTPPRIGTKIPFEGTTLEQGTLYVPIGCKSAFQSDENWGNFSNIEEYDFSSIESILDDNKNETMEYYNLQGIKVNNPERGLYIKRQGNKTTKIVL